MPLRFDVFLLTLQPAYLCIMALNNPFNNHEHKVYNRTFLLNVSAGVSFADKPLSADAQGLVSYLKDNFNVLFKPQDDKELTTITVASKDNGLSFSFSTGAASVSIDAKSYKSFASTMLPDLGKIGTFLSIRKVDELKTLSLTKRNQWKINTENALSVYKEAILYTFKEKNIHDITSIEVPDGPWPVKLSREASLGLEDGSLKVIFSVEIVDNEHIVLTLDLVAEAKDVPARDLLQYASTLNDVIYGAFHDMVSDDVIALMEKQ